MATPTVPAEVDFVALRDAVAARMRTVDGLLVYPYFPGQIQPPCVGLLSGEPYIDREMSMGGRGLETVALIAAVLVRLGSVEQSQRDIDELVQSVVPALLTVPDPVDIVGALKVPTVGGHDEVEFGGVKMLACRIDITCQVRRPAP